MKTSLYIVGAGSVGGHIAHNIEQYSGDYEIKGFFDDDPEKISTKQFGFSVLGPVEEVLDLKNEAIVLGIAFPKIKKEIFDQISGNSSLYFPSLIHDKAWVSNAVSIGKGSVIYPGTSINYGSGIGDFVVINMNCALGHHTRIGSYSSLAPGVNTGGHTEVKDQVDIGIGASTVQGIILGTRCVIGGQAMVISDIPEDSTAVGIPAKITD